MVPPRRRQSITSGSFQYELLADPKGLIKSIDVLEAIRCLGSASKLSYQHLRSAMVGRGPAQNDMSDTTLTRFGYAQLDKLDSTM